MEESLTASAGPLLPPGRRFDGRDRHRGRQTLSDSISNGALIAPVDRDWAEERLRRLASMTAALDEDRRQPPFPSSGEWAAFWQAMRQLYSRTAVYLATGIRTGDIRALQVGRLLWTEIHEGLDRAGKRLEISRSDTS